MRRLSSPIIAVVATVALGVSAAVASPPTGQLTFEDHGRAQVAEGGDVRTPAGTTTFIATYSVPAGASSGWRALPGNAIVAAVGGEAMVHRGDGCSMTLLPAGQAMVLPAGPVAVHNGGSAPLQVAAAFFGLPAGAADPLAGGTPAAAPAGCPDMAPGAGVSAVELGKGTVVDPNAYHGQGMVVSDTNPVKAGDDVLFSSYRLEPGASSGWINHRGQFGVITAGTLTYYEAHHGECVKTDAYSAGSAFFHGPHHHMAVNEGNEPLTLTIAHFNVPHNDHPAPVVGNQGDAFDFTPAPPADCPRLR